MLDIRSIPVSARFSFLYAEYGSLELDGHAVVLRQGETLTHFPIGSACAVLVLPGTAVTHAAVKACAEEGCALIWVGENGVRLYSAGNPLRDETNLLRQASIKLNADLRLNAARRVFEQNAGASPDLPVAGQAGGLS
jgi:CRISPR-associated protein Cas1